MKKATVAVLSQDLAPVVYSLQRCGQFMPIDSEQAQPVKTGQSPSLYEEADGALAAYSAYRKKKGLLSAPAEYSEEEFETESEQQRLYVIKAIELSEQLDSTNTRLKHLKEAYSALTPFMKLTLTAEDATDTKYTKFILGRIPYTVGAKKEQVFDSVCAAYGLEPTVFYDGAGQRYFYVCVFRDDYTEVQNALNSAEFEQLTLPYKAGTAKTEAASLSKQILQLEYSKETIEKALEKESVNADSVELFYDKEKAKADRAEIPAQTTKSTVVITGWVRSDKTEAVQAAIANTTDVFDIDFCDPEPDEIPPTVTKDSKFVSQYTTITNSFSAPGKNDIDPNPIMAPWYFLLYGMMVADVGYGAIMAVLFYLFKRFKKPRGETLKLVNLIWYSSITSIIFGVLYGSYFGSELLPPVWMNPQDGANILTSMAFCIIVGALHLFTGMTVNAVESIKQGHILDAVCDQFSWMFLITGIGLLFVPALSKVGMYVAIAMAALILCTGGRKKKGVFGKITGGLLALYNITSFLSDLLSYTRIFALALSTGIIGMVMNMLAGMVMGLPPVINVIAAAVICLAGHGLNVVLGLLGAYVHTSRLQYIEFFNKFYEGGGVPFKPLRIDTKYTVIKNQE